jgi:predicted permease
MAFWRPLWRGAYSLILGNRADRHAHDEAQHYLDEAIEDLVGRGMSDEQARRTVRLQLGSVSRVTEDVRTSGWEQVVRSAAQDVRIAARMLRKNPVFTLVTVVCLSLGSGAVTTIFSTLNALILRPLPGAADATRLVRIERKRPDGSEGISASFPYYRHLRDRARTLEGLAAWDKCDLTIGVGRRAGTTVYGNLVSGNFFSVLGVRPALGRFFASEEDVEGGASPPIVVSEAYWRSRLDADPTVIGRPITVNGLAFTLIGVAPIAFQGLDTPVRTDAWVPLHTQRLLRRSAAALSDASATTLSLCGRLRAGLTDDLVQRELSALTIGFAKEGNEPRNFDGFTDLRVSRLTGLPPDASGPLTGFLTVLLGASALVLLIAGVNVAFMLSARALIRQREMAVRASLGAGRARLVAQQVTEILLLFALGGCGGVAIAVGATRALEQLPITQALPVALDLAPDLRVLAFALLVATVTGGIFGLPPALNSTRADLTTRLRRESAGGGSRRGWMSQALIIGQLALSLTLLVAAGLFLRALGRGAQVERGFETADVTVASFNSEAWGYDEPRGRVFYERLRDQIEALPGVAVVSYATYLPLTLQSTGDAIQIDGRDRGVISAAAVDRDYFAVLRLPLIEGRALDRHDTATSDKVAVINETFARRGWPRGRAVGQTFQFRGQFRTVVGIARDAKYSTLDEETPAFAYLPLTQAWEPKQLLLVRTRNGAPELAPRIQDAMRSIDPALPSPAVTTLQQETAIVLLPQRLAAIVTGALGGVGLLLATVGLYGIVAYSASRRTREIAVRMALGARKSDVLRMTLRDGLRLTAVGVLIGWTLAAATARFVAAFLFGVSPLDLTTFAGMSAVFVVTATVASFLPARRAAALDPSIALRAE